jgi:polysaccharide export outer membrane protein
LTTETRIEKNGSIRFPLLGSVSLAGKTIEQATEEVRHELGTRFIKNPQVTLTISSFAKQWVTILGEVKNPGEVDIPDEGSLDLLGAIALAGGYTDIAEISHITVRRLVNGRDEIIEVDAKKLAHDSTVKPFYVQPGDTITIRQRMF